MADHGVPWPAMAGHGWPWRVITHNEWPWPAKTNPCLPYSVIAGHSALMAGQGEPSLTMAHQIGNFATRFSLSGVYL